MLKEYHETNNSSAFVSERRPPPLQTRVASTTDARKRRLNLIQNVDHEDFLVQEHDQIEEIDDELDSDKDQTSQQHRKAVVAESSASRRTARREQSAGDQSDLEPVSEDDDDHNDEEFRPKKKSKRLVKKNRKQPVKQSHDQTSDSDSVVVIGSLLDEQKAASSKPKKSAVVPVGGYRQSTLTLTKRKRETSLSNASTAEKRIQSNQLFSTEATASTTTTASTSLPRRGGTSAAETRVLTERSTTKWTKVREMCREMELDGNFTAVDVGRVNMGIVRINCSGSRIVLKDWMLINLDTLAKDTETDNPQKKFRDSAGRYSNEDHCHILYEWVCQQSRNDRIFDSSVVLIESQSFTREMKALQTAIHLAVVHSKPSIMVRLNNPELGPIGIREANFVSSAVIVSANSVKTCYAAFFPRVTETLATTKAKNPGKKFKAFGHAEANRDPDDNVNNSKQYAQNKKNSVLYGQQLISVDRIIELLPHMSQSQKTRFRAAKKDDIYDALWIVLFGIESWLPALYGRRDRGYGADSTMYGALPQRRYRTCDAMFEFAESVGTPEETIVSFQELLHLFRTQRDIIEDNGEVVAPPE